jgi:asparagine synthase (glutamine-hydrolysing)
MANSVECRTPFLDPELIEFSSRIPVEYFLDIDRLSEKDLLKRAMKSRLPEFMSQPQKHPFLSPNWRSFYHTPRGREIFEHYMSSRSLEQSGIFQKHFFKLLKAGWKSAPEGSKFFKRVDTFLGFALGVQVLEERFVAQRPMGDSNFAMIDRTLRPHQRRSPLTTAPYAKFSRDFVDQASL